MASNGRFPGHNRGFFFGPQGPKITQKLFKNGLKMAPGAPPGPGGTILGYFEDPKKMKKNPNFRPTPPGRFATEIRKHVKILHFSRFFGPKWWKKKLRLRGWDLSGEIRAEILRRVILILSKMVRWRPGDKKVRFGVPWDSGPG